MKNRNTSWDDNYKLELLIAAGVENVTTVTNGIAFNGDIPLCLDEQTKLNELYKEAATNHRRKLNDEYDIEQKTNIINRHSCSRDIANELIETANLYYWECDDDTFAVREVPYGIASEIETLLSVLSDLSQYKESRLLSESLSKDLAYLAEFFNDEEDEAEEDESEEVEAA